MKLLNGELGQDVVVRVDIEPGGTATSKSYHIHNIPLALMFFMQHLR